MIPVRAYAWLLLTVLSPPPSAAAAPAEWPMYRHDQRLTSRSEGAGGLAEPRLSWRYDLRGWEVRVAVRSGKGGARAPLEAPAEPFDLGAEEQAAWGLTAPLVDLRGDDNVVPAPKYAAKILPDVPGLQHPATVMENNVSGWCVLSAYDRGDVREVWRSEKFEVYQGPHPIVADANADGQLDIIACPHYRIVVMDGRTGSIIQQLRWHGGRNYGHFIAKNIDDDPALEFLVLADFYTHIDLIDNDGTDLKLLWRKEIELKIENKQKILRPRWDSLQDLDGDGRFEVITNLYNDTGDHQWRLMVYDALTGDTVLDLPGIFMSGLEDVDGDGVVELFCSETSALFEPTSSRLSILNLADGEASERWTYPRGAWVTHPRRYPLHINSLVAHAQDNIASADLGDGRRAFYIATPPAKSRGPVLTQFVMGADGSVVRGWSLTAPADARKVRVLGHRRSPDGSTDALVSFDTRAAGQRRLRAKGCATQAVSWTRTLPAKARWGNLVAADMTGDGGLTVAAVAAGSRVVGLRPPAGGAGEASPLWQRLGAGALAAADFDGDGAKELAMLGWEDSGQGIALTVDGSGKVRWRAPVAGFPGPMEPWNFGTLTTLAAGRLSGGDSDDLIVFSRRSTMHSDEGHAFRGADGSPLWSRTGSFDGQRTWGFGGTPVAVLDTNGDGADDILSLYPVNLTVVSGKDGEQLHGRSSAGDSIFPGVWAAYALPTVFDYEGDGERELTWNGGYCIGVTNLAGDTRWSKTPAAEGFPVDADDDGRWEIASALDKTLRWLDPASGEVRWSIDLPASAGQTAIADVDGDGVEEALVSCGKMLVAANASDGQPAILWQLEAPASIDEFILADTDADGKLEAVLLGSDGWLYGVNGSD